ncbi:MAG: SDR family oxidoreductase [Anaerolineae bacterium]|nr:SDR family oxidoreductase [Anaerolineae bacterium]
MPQSLAGRVALVTGGARGIGRGIALALAEAGADVALADLLEEQAQSVSREIEALGRRALVVRTDVTDRAQVERAVQATVAHFGRLDIAVANAARSIRRRFIELSWDDAWATFSVTLFGVWHTCQFAAQHMVRQGEGGKIIIISSIMSELATADSSAYNSAKAALNEFGRTIANELAEHRINVNVIQPGWIDTPGERMHFSEEEIQEGGSRMPWGRLGQPEEIGRLARFLASPEADYMTGSIVRMDGGLIMRM